MSHTRKGHLKIYFGYAAGVGKTFQLLEEARRLKAEGVHVVIGTLCSQQGRLGRRSNARHTNSGEQVFSEEPVSDRMDLEQILQQSPQVCVVDELAYFDSAGAQHSKRWADVQVLLDAGIDVLTTLNVYNLASLTDQIWHITGLRMRETVPDWVFQQADEVVMVDVTPRALIHRRQRGAITTADSRAGQRELKFDEATLSALRELAIRETAQTLEARQLRRSADQSTVPERILVYITADPAVAALLRRAQRIADYFQAECAAVCVYRTRDFHDLAIKERRSIERHMRFAESLRIRTVYVHGRDRARTLVDYGRQNGFTQIFLQDERQQKRPWFRGLNFTDEVLRRACGLTVTLAAEQGYDGFFPCAYPEDEAGTLMHSAYVRLAPAMNVQQSIAQIRRDAAVVEMIHYAYVVNAAGQLAGVVSFRELLAADRSRSVQDVMRTDYLFVSEDTDKRAVAQLLAKQRLLAIPVLADGGRLRGIINSVDLVEMVQQATSDSIQKIGGTEALDGPYLQVSFSQMVKKRAGWLAILFLGEMLTATAMGYFEDELSKAVVLALFLPLIISSGGNSGSQATTLVIRAMAVGELRLSDWLRVVRRELTTGIALGSILGIIGILRILVWQATRNTYGVHYALIALTIGCSLVGVVLFGAIAGSMLPFVLRRCGLDPASASAPFVATLVDVTGLVIYFSMARLILSGTLL